MTKMREKNGIYERQPFELFAYHDKKPTLDHSVFHFHNNYEILLYVKGNLEIYIEQSRYLPVPGTMFVISTEEVHKGTILDSEDYERYVIHNPLSYSRFLDMMWICWRVFTAMSLESRMRWS